MEVAGDRRKTNKSGSSRPPQPAQAQPRVQPRAQSRAQPRAHSPQRRARSQAQHDHRAQPRAQPRAHSPQRRAQPQRLLTLSVTVTEPDDGSGISLTETVIMPQEASTLSTKPDRCKYPWLGPLGPYFIQVTHAVDRPNQANDSKWYAVGLCSSLG